MKKNLDEARRDYFDFELQAKYLKIDKLINNRKRDLLQNYEAQNMNMKKFQWIKWLELQIKHFNKIGETT